MTATMLYALAGRVQDFQHGRLFAACPGLAPREHFTGAQACLRSLNYPGSKPGDCRLREWIEEVKGRRGMNKAALADRNARTAFSMLKNSASCSLTSLCCRVLVSRPCRSFRFAAARFFFYNPGHLASSRRYEHVHIGADVQSQGRWLRGEACSGVSGACSPVPAAVERPGGSSAVRNGRQ